MNRKPKISLLIVLIGLPLWLTSCLNSNSVDPDPYKLHNDTVAIDNYLNSGLLPSVHDPNGLRMVITKLGTGLPAAYYDSVQVDYIGELFSDGSIFDQHTNFKTIIDNNLIGGWQLAFTTLPEGSEAMLYLPSFLGYGSQAHQAIPANSILVFNVKFDKVIKTAAQAQKFTADTTAIENYLSAKGITGVSKDTTGLRYIFTQAGGGAQPTWYSKVKINFKYRLLTNDATVVADETGTPSSYFYSRVVDYINGMKLGLMKMSKGSKATFYIPSGLGYGTHDTPSTGSIVVPANSNLIVDIELVDIVQ